MEQIKDEGEMGMKTKKVGPLYGLLVFIIGLVLLYTVGFWVQYQFGMAGLAISEIMILLIGLIPALLLKLKLKEVFPIKRVTLKGIIGTVLLWGGSYMLALIATLITACFFPAQVFGINSQMSTLFQSVPFLVSFLLVAVMPAICEEVMCRGFIQYTLRGVKCTALTVLIMGIYFGIFHIDPFQLSFVRFLPTAILGISTAYVMVKTGNLIYPMLLHFINNALSVISSAGVNQEQLQTLELNANTAFMSLGSILVLGVIMPPCLLGAYFLLKDKEEIVQMKKTNMIILIASGIVLMGVMFLSGLMIIIIGSQDGAFSDIWNHTN